MLAAVALGGCVLLLAAGCGTRTAGASGKSPQQVVAAAAVHSAEITSANATLTEQVGGAAGETISGSVREQLKPVLRMSMKLKITSAAVRQNVGGIITGKAVYLSISAVARQTGKQWLMVPFSALSGGNSSLAELFKSLSKINPAQQTAVFAGARHVRDLGTDVIDGATTTEYSGSVVPSSGLAALPPGLRKSLAPSLKTISGTIRFRVWIDKQDHIRKQVLNETANGAPITTTVIISAINQPVHVTVPPASQVATIPSSALHAASA